MINSNERHHLGFTTKEKIILVPVLGLLYVVEKIHDVGSVIKDKLTKKEGTK